MAGFSSSRLSSRNAVFVASEGVYVPCTARLVSCESESCTLLLHGLNENTKYIVLICFITTTKYRWSVIFTL